MKTYNLTGTVTISIYTTVKAKSLKEAINIAKNREIEANNWPESQCNSVWVSDEFDGTPQNIEEA